MQQHNEGRLHVIIFPMRARDSFFGTGLIGHMKNIIFRVGLAGGLIILSR